MTVFLATSILANIRWAGLSAPTAIVCVWAAACLAAGLGVAFSCRPAGRKPALAMAYLSIGCVGFLGLWILARHDWSLLEIVAATGRMWIKTAMTALIVGTPCSFGMLLILYHRQKIQPPKTTLPPREDVP
ncbi:MAG: hypothetical protein FWE88_06830 [Phycisphaerae bacterium]|nr:hypothetical protein [Phycisphaerae bacterium]